MYSTTSPQPYDCNYDDAAAWAPIVCQEISLTDPETTRCHAYTTADGSTSDMDPIRSFSYANGVLDAISVEPCEAADSFFASTGKSPPQSIVPSPSVAGDVNVSLSCSGDIAQAASSILALTSGVKRWARWTAEEDQLLENAVAMEGIENWILISAKYFNGSRNEVQIKNRWRKTLQPRLKKNVKWTEEEDAIILESVVHKGITSWSEIALLLQGEYLCSSRAVLLLRVTCKLLIPLVFCLISGKSSDEIRDHYETALDTTAKKNTKWTEEEYKILKEQHAKHGNCWTTIASKLHGRTERNVKSKWYNMKTSEKRAAAAAAASLDT